MSCRLLGKAAKLLWREMKFGSDRQSLRQSNLGKDGGIHPYCSVSGCPNLTADCLINNTERKRKDCVYPPPGTAHQEPQGQMCKGFCTFWTLNLRYGHLKTWHEVYKAPESIIYNPVLPTAAKLCLSHLCLLCIHIHGQVCSQETWEVHTNKWVENSLLKLITYCITLYFLNAVCFAKQL